MLRNRIIVALCVSMIGVLCISGIMVSAGADARVADAAKRGDTVAVRALLKEAVDVNASQGDGMTALHWAAMKGDAELAQLLLYAGANVRAATRIGGYTPLFMAAERGSAPVADLLLKAGADPKQTAMHGMTPLMTASISGNPDALKVLIERGADVNAKETDHGQTPLSFAAAFDRGDAIRVLMQHGADPNIASKVVAPAPPARDFTQMPMPANGQPAPAAAAPAAATATAPPAAAPAAPGANAAGGRGGRGAQGPAQPAAGAAPAAAGQQQAQNNNNGADASARGGGNPKGGFTPLMYAARQGSHLAAKTLIDGGAKLDETSGDKSTALLFAIINGHFDIAKALIDKGANVTIPSMDGATPLYVVVNTQWARKSFHPQPTARYAQTTYLDLMNAIMDRGGNPNAKLVKELWYSEYNFGLISASAAGTTAIWKCAEVGDIDCMRLLVSRGADPNIASTDGVTALLMATGAGVHGNDDVSAPTGRLLAVKYLIEELHADVNAADTGGNSRVGANVGNEMVAVPVPAQPATAGTPAAVTPAAAAAAQQQVGGRTPSGGFTALHNAAARGDNEMIIYLISKGAKVDAVSKGGVTVVDMANGPRQRIQPYPETVALLEMLGSKNSHKCVSC